VRRDSGIRPKVRVAVRGDHHCQLGHLGGGAGDRKRHLDDALACGCENPLAFRGVQTPRRSQRLDVIGVGGGVRVDKDRGQLAQDRCTLANIRGADPLSGGQPG